MTKQEQLRSDIIRMRKELEMYEDCLKYAVKYTVLGDIEHYGDLRNKIIRHMEKAEAELQQLKSA
ncbi:hypothetical protein D3C75_1332740 [compost metagenome]